MKRQALPLDAIAHARALRRDATPAERRLWLALREGLPEARFRRQAPIGPYFADFCSHAARLIVEVDGAQHKGAEAEADDAARTRFLEREGYRVLRFWNHEVIDGLEWVLERIMAELPELAPRKRRVREEQEHFIGLSPTPITLLPPCGGERREAAAEGGAGDQPARDEVALIDELRVQALRARAGRPHPSSQPSPLRGEGVLCTSEDVALRAPSLRDGTPTPARPTRGREGMTTFGWSPSDASP